MSISQLEDDLGIIAALDDEPNDEGGLTASQLKAKFDEAGNTIKDYINDTLIPDVSEEIDAKVAAAELASGNIPVGGTTGQALVKQSGTDYDAAWDDIPGESTATPSTLIMRDANGRAKVADPSENADIATKGYVDGMDFMPVGSVYIGLENPWGDNGALCNGAQVTETAYPELYDLMYPTPDTDNWIANSTSISSPVVYGIDVFDGKTVAWGRSYDSIYGPYIFYKDPEDEQFTFVQVAALSGYFVYDMVYDGVYYWLYVTSGSANYLYYSSTAYSGYVSAGTISLGSSYSYVKMFVVNGYVCILYADTGATYVAKMYYFPAGNFSSLSVMTFSGTTYEYPRYMEYDGSEYHVICSGSGNTPIKYSSSSLSTGWTKTTSPTSNLIFTKVMKIGDEWCLFGSYNSYPAVHRTSDFVTFTSFALNDDIAQAIYDIKQLDSGLYVATIGTSLYTYLMWGLDLNKKWEVRNCEDLIIDYALPGYTRLTQISGFFLQDNNGYLDIASTCRYNTAYFFTEFHIYTQLPNIATNSAYAFIKLT